MTAHYTTNGVVNSCLPDSVERALLLASTHLRRRCGRIKQSAPGKVKVNITCRTLMLLRHATALCRGLRRNVECGMRPVNCGIIDAEILGLGLGLGEGLGLILYCIPQ